MIPYNRTPFHSIPYYMNTIKIPYSKTPFHTIPYYMIKWYTIHTITCTVPTVPFNPYNTTQYYNIPYHALSTHTKPFATIPCHSIYYHTKSYLVIPYNNKQYYTIVNLTIDTLPYHVIIIQQEVVPFLRKLRCSLNLVKIKILLLFDLIFRTNFQQEIIKTTWLLWIIVRVCWKDFSNFIGEKLCWKDFSNFIGEKLSWKDFSYFIDRNYAERISATL